MSLIIKKFVKVYPDTANVPEKYKNLKKSTHVRTFSRPFPTIPEILVREYGLGWDEKIVVFHTMRIENFKGWKNYRTPFKKIYYGTVSGFGLYLKDFLRKVAEIRKNKHS